MEDDEGEGVFTQTSHGHEIELIPDAASAPAMHHRHDVSHDKASSRRSGVRWILEN